MAKAKIEADSGQLFREDPKHPQVINRTQTNNKKERFGYDKSICNWMNIGIYVFVLLQNRILLEANI